MKQITLNIGGMSCGHCLNAVNQALGSAPGVELDSVQMGRATIRYDERVTDLARIEAAVAAAGYTASAVGA